jgi:myo-inositol-1(or 4)-monophosphatase
LLVDFSAEASLVGQIGASQFLQARAFAYGVEVCKSGTRSSAGVVTNFIQGFPQYAVSIAWSVNGVTQQAVVYDPTRDELFTATRGAGAYLDRRRLRVATQDRLVNCLLGTGFPYREDQDLEKYLKVFADMTRQCAGLRRPGAASLDLAYVAAGRYDGFFESDLKPWDMAAGALLITESGGLIGNYRGEEGFLQSGEVMCANPRIFAQMVQCLSKYSNC